jgi:hypothetical protein
MMSDADVIIDLATLLYLNPELVAHSNLGTVEAAAAAFEADASGSLRALAAIASSMPATPHGFDAKVYLSAQPDVSGLNDTIRLAMLGVGLTPEAVERRGTYVSTLMDDVVLDLDASPSPSNLAFACEFANEAFEFSPCNLRAGDRIRLQRQGGRADMYGAVVTSVDTTERFSALLECAPAYLGCSRHGADAPDAPPGVFTLLGIRVHDAERQALVTYVRNSNAAAASYAAAVAAGDGAFYVDSNATPADDVSIRGDFSLDTYRAVYPDTRALSLPDAYLDYRTRWKRRNEYRVIKGRDVFNLAAPYTSNLLYGTTAGGQNFQVYGDLSTCSNTLRVSKSNAFYDGTLLVGRIAGTAAGTAALSNAAYAVIASSSNVLAGTASFAWLPPTSTSAQHAGPGSSGLWSSNNALRSLDGWLRDCPSAPGKRLVSIANDDGVTPCLLGGAVDIAGGFLHAQPNVLAFAGGAVVVTRNGDLVCGGDASNLAVLNSNQVTQLNAACLVVSASNAVVAEYLTVGRPGTGLGRVGIGMECLGDEGALPDGWGQGDSDPANFDLQTRLAVAGDIFATGTVVTLSDARVKSDLRPIAGALEKVLALSGYTYDVDVAGGVTGCGGASRHRRHTGLLAQDVAAAMPEAVYRVPSTGMLSVAYGNLAGLLVEAIKELAVLCAARPTAG